MARPRGRLKNARITVNLDESAYMALLAFAQRRDLPVAQIARVAVLDYLRREEPSMNAASSSSLGMFSMN